MSSFKFFNKLEDKIRGWLSHRPLLYAFIGGIGALLFWRGIWLMADFFSISGPLSFVIGAVMLIGTGLLVSVFIGDQVIISGMRGEKRITQKTEKEIEDEETLTAKIHNEIHGISKRLARLEKKEGLPKIEKS